MIAKLTGELAEIAADHIILDVHGVGYHVSLSAQAIRGLPAAGSRIAVLTETVIREDSWQLFGFTEAREQQWFRRLLTVQGVGPKAALAVLSVLSPEALSAAILTRDKTALMRADGVGAKVADRILLEMKGRKDIIAAQPPSAGDTAPSSGAFGAYSDLAAALTGLGFEYNRVSELAATLCREQGELPIEDLLKLALMRLQRS